MASTTRYAAGKIYCIRNRKAGDGIVYVGSTTQALCERMSQHRRNVKHRPEGKLYMLMNKVGVEHFYIELVSPFPCKNKDELFREEGRHIRLHRPECNTYIAGQTKKENYEANRETVCAQQKAYYEANRAAVNARNKKYNEANREAIDAWQKAYREANHESRAVQNKAYREANRVAIAARDKAYRATHRESIAAYKKAYSERKKGERTPPVAPNVEARA